MYAESHRPVFLDDVIGHQEIKQELKIYVESKTFGGSVFLVGSPGIGKTTMALCAARIMHPNLYEALKMSIS